MPQDNSSLRTGHPCTTRTGGSATRSDMIRAERTPLPAHDLQGVNYRKWAAAVCAAEVKHAADDFWSAVHRLGFGALFDRNDGFGGHEAPFRFPHETHAFAALAWLMCLQAHESDRRGPWARVRWNIWDAGQRADWSARRRVLWSGFVRQVERYRTARLDAPTIQLVRPISKVTA